MGKVFAKLAPKFETKIVCLEVDVNTEANYPILDRFKILTIPTSVLIDNNGIVKERISGVLLEKEMEEKLFEIVR